ncbi:hypothetical protein AB0N73_13020 [Microbacterium sp. NPDC089189]|uniref:hypothetical protein n=1 Tax=Microbacterium sp. NPDC089189 TaxID=3154972 RepID=UPI003414FC7F
MTDDTNNTTPEHRLGHQLRALRQVVAARRRRILREEGIARHEWAALRALDAATTTDESRPDHDHHRGFAGPALHGLYEHGWAEEEKGAWRPTAAGRAILARVEERLTALRAEAEGSVDAEALATTLATLRTITDRVGESLTDAERAERRGRGRHGFGPRGFGPFGRGGFGPGFRGFGRRFGGDPRGTAPWGDPRGHGDEPCHRGHRPHPHDAEGGNRHRGFGPGEGPVGSDTDPRI